MKILFKYATRGRPEWFKRTLAGYYANLSGNQEYEFRVSIDADDATMNNPEMLSYLDGQPELNYYIGNSKTKIEAINADMEGAEFDILVNVSDDMEVKAAGFDDIIVRDMLANFPECDGALHYNDGLHGKDTLITLSIMGKKMYDLFGYIYYPGYKSVWCDNEFMDSVQILRKYWYSDEVIIQHSWMIAGNDETYARNAPYFQEDHLVYDERAKIRFGLTMKEQAV